jgi:hypothetical protein
MGPEQEKKPTEVTDQKVAEKKLEMPNPLNLDPNLPDFKLRGLARKNVNFNKAAAETKKA